MEGLKFCVLFFLMMFNSYAGQMALGNLYYINMMGHVHKNPSDSSSTLTTIQCAHPVKILEDDEVTIPEGWVYVQVGEDKGFIASKNLTSKRPDCFQERYPKFFINLNLDLTDMYYWGRLYDQYSAGETKIK